MGLKTQLPILVDHFDPMFFPHDVFPTQQVKPIRNFGRWEPFQIRMSGVLFHKNALRGPKIWRPPPPPTLTPTLTLTLTIPLYLKVDFPFIF